MSQGLEYAPYREFEPATAEVTGLTVTCSSLDARIVQTAVNWLRVQAQRTELNAVIVVSSMAQAECLRRAISSQVLNSLIMGNVVRMDGGFLELQLAREIVSRARRRNVVVLMIGLADEAFAAVQGLQPAAWLRVAIRLE
jgi:hypothetical protein